MLNLLDFSQSYVTLLKFAQIILVRHHQKSQQCSQHVTCRLLRNGQVFKQQFFSLTLTKLMGGQDVLELKLQLSIFNFFDSKRYINRPIITNTLTVLQRVILSGKFCSNQFKYSICNKSVSRSLHYYIIRPCVEATLLIHHNN